MTPNRRSPGMAQRPPVSGPGGFFNRPGFGFFGGLMTGSARCRPDRHAVRQRPVRRPRRLRVDPRPASSRSASWSSSRACSGPGGSAASSRKRLMPACRARRTTSRARRSAGSVDWAAAPAPATRTARDQAGRLRHVRAPARRSSDRLWPRGSRRVARARDAGDALLLLRRSSPRTRAAASSTS